MSLELAFPRREQFSFLRGQSRNSGHVCRILSQDGGHCAGPSASIFLFVVHSSDAGDFRPKKQSEIRWPDAVGAIPVHPAAPPVRASRRQFDAGRRWVDGAGHSALAAGRRGVAAKPRLPTFEFEC